MENEKLEAWMRESARILGLEIPEVCLPGVLENLEKNFAIAEILFGLEIRPEIEAAPIFRA